MVVTKKKEDSTGCTLNSCKMDPSFILLLFQVLYFGGGGKFLTSYLEPHMIFTVGDDDGVVGDTFSAMSRVSYLVYLAYDTTWQLHTISLVSLTKSASL